MQALKIEKPFFPFCFFAWLSGLGFLVANLTSVNNEIDKSPIYYIPLFQKMISSKFAHVIFWSHQLKRAIMHLEKLTTVFTNNMYCV